MFNNSDWLCSKTQNHINHKSHDGSDFETIILHYNAVLVNRSGISGLPVMRRIQSNTNRVYSCGNKFIYKCYSRVEGYLAELSILKSASRFSFRVPELVDHFVFNGREYWVVTEQVDEVDLLSHIENNGSVPVCAAKKITSALTNFETIASNIIDVGIKRRSISERLASLAEYLATLFGKETVQSLRDAFAIADKELSYLPFKPCFDCYPRNILICSSGIDSADYIFCDFDKAYNLVPVGEQLSHMVCTEYLSNHISEAVEFYSKANNISVSTVNRVLKLTCFPRSLAFVQDTIKSSDPERLGLSFSNSTLYRYILDHGYYLADFVSEAKVNSTMARSIDNVISNLQRRLS